MDPADLASVRAWVDEWGAQVAAVEMDAARLRFADDVVAFGTFANVVVGLDQLYDDQWSQVWPTIEGFRFLTDAMEVLVAPGRLMAVAVVGWDSVGVAEDGTRFPRPGRATIVLTRAAPTAPWVGRHTHFSLARA